jgi:hypothetical protein
VLAVVPVVVTVLAVVVAVPVPAHGHPFFVVIFTCSRGVLDVWGCPACGARQVRRRGQVVRTSGPPPAPPPARSTYRAVAVIRGGGGGTPAIAVACVCCRPCGCYERTEVELQCYARARIIC